LGTKLTFSTAFHPQTDGQSERVIQILEDLFRASVLDFSDSWDFKFPVIEFTYNSSYQASIEMAPYEALYGRKCRLPILWDDIGEITEIGPDIVEQTTEAIKRIRDRIKTAQSRQKSYADSHRRDLNFEVGDHVFLKISPMKGVIRFGRKGNLSPRFIGPFQILERIGTLAYRLALPREMSIVHNVFHISALRKYIANPSHVLRYEPIHLASDLTYEEIPEKILAKENRKLRNRTIPMIRIQLKNHSEREATWEVEADMQRSYSDLFK
ncbi:Retrotransposon protein, Ty3-gypsy subclass, partial [Dorcoceras hygrometricum]